MNRDIKVSVIIPCYNSANYIREAVDSILQQTHRNMEILLMDDGSTDNTRSIIAEYAVADKRVITVFNDKNLGLIRTLNKGVQMSTGEYIARMDSDDISTLNRIEVLLDTFVANPELDVISAGFYHMSDDGKRARRVYPKATLSKALYFVSLFSTPVNHPCVMVKTNVFKDNPFDELYIHSEDYELFSRLLFKGYKFMNLVEPLYYLRENPNSVSHRFEQIQISTHMRISVMNIDNYFGIKYDYFQHKVMVNRISFDVTRKLMNDALNTLHYLRNQFIKREGAGKQEIIEIDEFLIEQKIDIYLQTLKYAKWIRKPFVLIVILRHLNLFTHSRGATYFKLKFKKPLSQMMQKNAKSGAFIGMWEWLW